MDYSMTGKIRERTGNRNPHFVPAEDFDTQDDHMRQREAIIKFDDPEKGKILLPGIFPKMTESPGCV